MMKRVRFTEEQIIGVLREQEAGAKAAELCGKYGMSNVGGDAVQLESQVRRPEVSEAKPLRALELWRAKFRRIAPRRSSPRNTC